MPDYLMAIDVGTTGANAMIFDPDGRQYGNAYREYVSHYPFEHHVEQDAETLVTSAFDVCREAAERSGIDPQNIKAVSMTSHRATFGLLGADNRLINGRFIVWQDNRAHSVLDAMAAKMPPADLYRITGMPLTPTYSLEKIVWFRRFQPDIFAKAKKIVFPADYVLWRFGTDDLTTEVTNACCSGMIDVHRLDWSNEVLAAFEVDRSLFTPLVFPGTVLGKINGKIAHFTGLKEGTLLVSATGDQQCAAIGAGVIDEGLASLTLGTAGL
ncbi:MAG: FGGY family carbohydrate kinase, partial [Planctomycetaceae bacterium]|nr:FGGY family carbohydrate kinase [Planctomycetaceae bacterium]